MIEIIQLLKDTKLEACIDNRSPFSFTRTGARESIFPTTRDKAYLNEEKWLFISNYDDIGVVLTQRSSTK